MKVTEVKTKQEVVQAPEISLQQWIFDRVKDYIGVRVLEIAAGEGIIAPVCVQNGIPVEIRQIDLADEDFEERYVDLIGQYDTLIVLNAGDQIKGNRNVVFNSTLLLKQGGYFITRLPACTALFNGLDQGFNYWKHYNLEYINKLLRRNCRILKTRYFLVDNFPPPSARHVTKYNERVTAFSELTATGMAVGLSMIVVGQKR